MGLGSRETNVMDFGRYMWSTMGHKMKAITLSTPLFPYANMGLHNDGEL
jgi:hypothetical protein